LFVAITRFLSRRRSVRDRTEPQALEGFAALFRELRTEIVIAEVYPALLASAAMRQAIERVIGEPIVVE
jgi:hypothetical protein